MLTGFVIAAAAALFLARNWRRPPTRQAKLQWASALVNAERVDEALAALDALDTRALDAPSLRDWLGLKGYALALAGRGEEALDCIDDLASLADPDDRTCQLMVNGTRAIVAIAGDDFDGATTLLDATEAAAGGTGPLAPSNLAEVWWWRAELASKRGDVAGRRASLEKAASYGEVHYAARARAALQSVAAT